MMRLTVIANPTACYGVLPIQTIEEVANIGVRGCLLEVLIENPLYRKEYIRGDNVCSEALVVTSAEPWCSLRGPLLFCISKATFSETNNCTWKIACDCITVRDNKTLFK